MPGRERGRRDGASLSVTPSHMRKKVFREGVPRKALYIKAWTRSHLEHLKNGKGGFGLRACNAALPSQLAERNHLAAGQILLDGPRRAFGGGGHGVFHHMGISGRGGRLRMPQHLADDK